MKEKIFKILSLTLVIVLFMTGCNKANTTASSTEENIHPELAKQLEKSFVYSSFSDTTYESIYDSEYWNSLEESSAERMYYDATVNLDFSESETADVYLYYGGNEEYSWDIEAKGIMFARYDHPELELMDIDSRSGFASSKEKGKIYENVSRYCTNYDEYKRKLAEVNLEIADLVKEVNATEDFIKKHQLIFDWIKNTVTYVKTDDAVGIVDWVDGSMVISRYETGTSQNIYGAIVNKEAICDGIADAYKYICNCCNLECMVVTGYIGELSEEQYHAWNIVKIKDTWYLIDATWDLGDKYDDYFLVKDLNKGERTPFDIGVDLPGYTDNNNNFVTFDESSTFDYLTTREGLTFSCNNSDFQMNTSDSGTIYTSISTVGWNKYSAGEDFERDLTITTNAEIIKAEYFDLAGSLFKIEEKSGNDIYFPEYEDDKYLNSMDVYLSYNNKIYKIKVVKGGV